MTILMISQHDGYWPLLLILLLLLLYFRCYCCKLSACLIVFTSRLKRHIQIGSTSLHKASSEPLALILSGAQEGDDLTGTTRMGLAAVKFKWTVSLETSMWVVAWDFVFVSIACVATPFGIAVKKWSKVLSCHASSGRVTNRKHVSLNIDFLEWEWGGCVPDWVLDFWLNKSLGETCG